MIAGQIMLMIWKMN